MTERNFAPPSQERMLAIPPQSRGREEARGFRVLTSPQQVADAADGGELVGAGNGSVYGIYGDCSIETTESKTEDIKGEARRGRPLGLTVPYTHPVLRGAFATSHIEDITLRKFVEPDELTDVIGALAFFRGEADEEAIAENKLPTCVISRPVGTPDEMKPPKPLLQVYSPIGNRIATEIIRLTIEKQKYTDKTRMRLPIMSSANKSGEPEITTTAKALEFTKEHNIPIFIDRDDKDRPQRPRGSYPIFQLLKSEIRIVRQGFLDEGILRRLLHGLPVSREMPVHPRPELAARHMLRLSDLVDYNAKAASYQGADMRKLVLDYMGLN